MKKLAVVILIALVGAVSLRADIIPSFSGTSPGSGTNTVWNYSINITSQQQVTTGDFFTIYDFGPFILGSNTQPAGWSFSTSLSAAAPPFTNPPNNPTLADLTWTYTGSAPIPSGTNLSGFSVAMATPQFQELPPSQLGYFAAQATRVSAEGSKISNVGRVPVPAPIPEPTTLSLLAFAGVGSALRAIRRRK